MTFCDQNWFYQTNYFNSIKYIYNVTDILILFLILYFSVILNIPRASREKKDWLWKYPLKWKSWKVKIYKYLWMRLKCDRQSKGKKKHFLSLNLFSKVHYKWLISQLSFFYFYFCYCILTFNSTFWLYFHHFDLISKQKNIKMRKVELRCKDWF